jgi:hypothetical protein
MTMAGRKTADGEGLGEAMDPGGGWGGHVLVINPDLLLYVGLHGSPSTRVLGAVTIYFALEQELTLSIGDEFPRACSVAVVPPYAPHQVSAAGAMYGVLLIEPEYIDVPALQNMLRDEVLAELALRVRAFLEQMGPAGGKSGFSSAALNDLLVDITLPRRRLDPRIEAVVEQIRQHPDVAVSATECAHDMALSPSRFIHLFNEELGVAFRAFRLWKRARSFLNHVRRQSKLTQLAMDTGYPDSFHFSHTIRRIYGLKPKDIFAGSRHLRLYGEIPSARAGQVLGKRHV